MDMLNQKQKIIIIVVAVIIAIIIFYYYINSTKDIYNYEQLNEIVETQKDNEAKEEKIIIHIAGAVKNNGIVEVKEGARINDAIEAAGGITEEADLSQVNLAYEIKDGQKIYIPNKADKKEVNDLDLISEDSGTNVIEENENNNSEIVNINTATKEELQTLPGIGESTANKIITYREQNGKFKTIEDIKNVSGIGDAKFENIKNYIEI